MMTDELIKEVALALGKHKYIVLQATKEEWQVLIANLLFNGTRTKDYWINNLNNARVTRFNGINSMRGARFNGGRPSLFIAKKGCVTNTDSIGIKHMLKPDGEIKYV